MPKAVLPEFQGYLLARQLVPEKNVSYYAWWASKFLTYSNNHEDLSLPLRLEKFIDHLGHQKQLEDWQLHQAREAVRLYVDHFLKEDKKDVLTTGQTSKPVSLEEVILKVRQAIRLKHYSYRTEISYLDWIKRFYEYIKNVKKKDVFSQPISSADVKEFLSYLAIKRRVSSSIQNQAFNALHDIFSHIK